MGKIILWSRVVELGPTQFVIIVSSAFETTEPAFGKDTELLTREASTREEAEQIRAVLEGRALARASGLGHEVSELKRI